MMATSESNVQRLREKEDLNETNFTYTCIVINAFKKLTRYACMETKKNYTIVSHMLLDLSREFFLPNVIRKGIEEN